MLLIWITSLVHVFQLIFTRRKEFLTLVIMNGLQIFQENLVFVHHVVVLIEGGLFSLPVVVKFSGLGGINHV